MLKYLFSLNLLLLLKVFSTSTTWAQNGSGNDTISSPNGTLFKELDEVVITATRVSKRIIDIPYSVVRLNFQNYRYERNIGSNDILSDVPGLFLQSRYGDHDVRFSIRGFGSRSNSGVRGVRILLDDIPESEPDGQTRLEALDFNSISRIEIVKGNASSLYTNAPGGVANFFNDIDFDRSSLALFNQFGSFGLWKSGFKSKVKTEKYRLLTAYSYLNYDGYRKHNNEYWNILNIVLETTPSAHTGLKMMAYYVDGMIKLPGSLTKEEYEKDPSQADPLSVSRDEKRITSKGRMGIRYNATFGRSLNNDVEITAFGAIKVFDRTARDYRIINRYAFGVSAKYINRHSIGERHNEFSFGSDLFSQPARTEYYENYHGAKGDQILQLVNESVSNKGFYFSDNFEILKEKMFILLTGRYDNIVYEQKEETLPSRNSLRHFNAFTPKLALNFKVTQNIVFYTSYGLSFDSPALNEMESVDPAFLYNQDLQPQKSNNFELGAKGYHFRWDKTFLRKIQFEATFFDLVINDEIIPYEVLGEVFYRNAARTNRMGFEVGTQLELLKDLDLAVSYTFSYFKYLAYTARAIDQDSTGNFIETDRDYSGNFAPSVPENNVYLALTYARPVIRNLNLFVKLSYMGISGLWVNDANTDKTKAANLINSILGLDFRFGKFNLMASGGVNNIFDEVYVGFTNTNSTAKRYYEAGAPRDYFCSVNLGYTFR